MTTPNISPVPEQSPVSDVSNLPVGGEQGVDATAPSGISTTDQLPAPVLNAIMQSIAYQVCSRSAESTRRIKEILDEAERNQK